MNKKVNRKDLIYRYETSHILSVKDFIIYCNERDVRVTEKELEYYDKRGVVIPVLGLNLNGNTLEHEFGDKYILWETLRENDIEPYYSIYQIYPLYLIKLKTTVSLSPTYFTYNEKQWQLFGKAYETVYGDALDNMQMELLEFVKNTAVILDLNTLAVQNTTKGENAYKESLKQTKSYRDAIADFSNAIKLSYKDAVPELHMTLEKHKINTKYLIEMQKKYIAIGGYQDPARKIYPHIININYFELMSCRGKLKFALESYGIAENISWAISALGKAPMSVTETLLKVKDYRICANPTCQKKFIPKKEIQFTCGNKDCTDYYRNLRKRQKRIPTK